MSNADQTRAEAPATAGALKAGIEQFRLGDRSDVAVLYPDVCFASLEAVGDMPVPLLVESVLTRWRSEDHLTTPARAGEDSPFPVAALVVSRDSRRQFHAELSNREPVEIQVWADGRITLEIEFQGIDVTVVDGAWLLTARRVLSSWAGAFGLRLRDVFNDRARSLADVWNAVFSVRSPSTTVGDLVALGERALRTAELSMTGWGGEEDVRRVLRDGTAHAVVGWRPSAVLEFWPAPPAAGDASLFASDVCAFANAVRGGAMIIGVTDSPDGARLRPFRAVDHLEDLYACIRDRVFPIPEGLTIDRLATDLDSSIDNEILVVRVPPQDTLLRPFLQHGGTVADDGNVITNFALVERVGSESAARSVAAVHSALAAGVALLRCDLLTDETGTYD